MEIGKVMSVKPAEDTSGMLQDRSQSAEARDGRRVAVKATKVGEEDFMVSALLSGFI